VKVGAGGGGDRREKDDGGGSRNWGGGGRSGEEVGRIEGKRVSGWGEGNVVFEVRAAEWG